MSIRRTSVSTQDHERHFQAEVPFVDTCVRQMDMSHDNAARDANGLLFSLFNATHTRDRRQATP